MSEETIDVDVHVEDGNQPPEEAQNTEPVETTEEPEKATEEPKTEPQAPVKREIHTMPVAKALEEKRKAAEKARAEAEAEWQAKLEAQRQEYEARMQSSNPSSADEELSRWAEQHGMDLDAAAGLLNIVKKSVPQADLSKYDALVREQELAAQKAQVAQEFDTKVVDLIKRDHPSASPEQIAQAKQKIQELAFTEGYNQYPVEHIYLVTKDSYDFDHGYTGEEGGGKTTDLVHFDSVSDEDVEKMSPEEYKQYSDYMASKGSRYLND